jgi:hypothetical protein
MLYTAIQVIYQSWVEPQKTAGVRGPNPHPAARPYRITQEVTSEEEFGQDSHQVTGQSADMAP